MKIHIYSIMRDEEDMLPYFLRYYSSFADRIFIIDDKSTDKTVEIAKTNKKVSLLDYKFTEGFVEEEHNACFEGFYKKYSRGVADWVMVVDADEFIYNKNLLAVLEKQQKLGRKLIKATGYNIFSQTFPTTEGQIYEECNMGIRAYRYDKTVVFNPSIDIRFGGGRHETQRPEGIEAFRAKILLLHFRYLSLVNTLKPFVKFKPYKGYRVSGHRKLLANIKEALARYENGIAALKRGKLIKVV